MAFQLAGRLLRVFSAKGGEDELPRSMLGHLARNRKAHEARASQDEHCSILQLHLVFRFRSSISPSIRVTFLDASLEGLNVFVVQLFPLARG